MNSPYSVTLKRLIDEIGLSSYYMPVDPEEVLITVTDVDRPGLELVGHLKYYDRRYLIAFGQTEMSFLEMETMQTQLEQLEPIISQKPPAMIIARDIEPLESMLELARKYMVPILTTADTTSEVDAAIVSFLNVELAQRITRHGVLVEVYGEGILLIGDSGVGKSETAIELIKRGHRLIADDAVEIKRVSKKSLIGSSPANIRHFIELRGIGIINARRIFGIGAVKVSEKIDLVINLELWNSKKVYDRMGMDNEYMEILGIEIPVVTIPVKPGRNLAVIIEVAAMNHRQKKMGYNGAQELLQNLGMDISPEDIGKKKIDTNW
ncbi:HPr(Ser) kinase/phosphatase [Ruminococcus sp.]|uniref:HPr(Ser) kinase/phosphatase n=1 Tax=Ruminococcus sp. TaxID=41978 RepID=UPI002E806E7A|nr:HPr(Ser) kinase/phosphatase [Ruminococcus sp.]MEE3491866.1 HPr(Ser) kinase/phosphatase [Ruminococcus sp.]